MIVFLFAFISMICLGCGTGAGFVALGRRSIEGDGLLWLKPQHICGHGGDVWDIGILEFARMFVLAMTLSKSKRNHCIYTWKQEYPACVTKVTSNYKDCNLGGFLVYNYIKLWDGITLPPINTVSKTLRMEFLADILASSANECYDNIPEDI